MSLTVDSDGLLVIPAGPVIPKSLTANLRFRREVLGMDPAGIRRICASDPLFYCNVFCFTYDPRKTPSAIPFITWPFQDVAIRSILGSIVVGEDLVIEKSRDMGASWLLLFCFEWLWHFHHHNSLLLVSRKEDLVDKLGDPKALFWKIDFIHKYLPHWLLPRMERKRLHIENLDTSSVISGESTTGDVARGDRRLAIGLDEFASVEDGEKVLASTADATNCRIFNSTPKGVGNAFYGMVSKPGIRKLRMHWSEHPEKSAGMYVDPRTGRQRSPWYDRECTRRLNPVEVAQELDIDYMGSDYQFFDALDLDRLEKLAKGPIHKGELDFDPVSLVPYDVFRNAEGKGRLWTWADPMPGRKYVIGVDIATGTGSSNSVLSVGDEAAGEKVAEWVHSRTRPDELARLCVAMARWYNGALIIPEANGPGRTFIDVVVESGYGNIFFRRNEVSISLRGTEVPGWWSTKDTKLKLFGEYRRALMTNEYRNWSYDSLRECREYVYSATGSIVHAKSTNTIDPSGAKDNHGDRPTADALSWMGMQKRSHVGEKIVAEAGSLAWRRQRIREREREKRVSY